jgi:hypothetical protein
MSTATVVGLCPTAYKQAHDTRDDAIRHMQSASKELGHTYLNVYQCACGAWHVGRSKKEFQKAINRAVSSGRHKNRLNNQRAGRHRR